MHFPFHEDRKRELFIPLLARTPAKNAVTTGNRKQFLHTTDRFASKKGTWK
jgi:hypothetical protein